MSVKKVTIKDQTLLFVGVKYNESRKSFEIDGVRYPERSESYCAMFIFSDDYSDKKNKNICINGSVELCEKEISKDDYDKYSKYPIQYVRGNIEYSSYKINVLSFDALQKNI